MSGSGTPPAAARWRKKWPVGRRWLLVAGLFGAIGPSWWWATAAALALGAGASLVAPRTDVAGAGALVVAAAGCVLGAGLATRRARTLRWAPDPEPELDQSRPPT